MKQYYAIKHLPTGKFLPSMGSTGQTWAEPTDKLPPRLFKEARHAKVALGWYLVGKVGIKPSSFYNPDAERETFVTKVPNRKPEFFKIIKFELVEKETNLTTNKDTNHDK